ncbi:MAG: hypothetical protein ACRD3W_13290, partial [Terriglobales bacterium]
MPSVAALALIAYLLPCAQKSAAFLALVWNRARNLECRELFEALIGAMKTRESVHEVRARQPLITNGLLTFGFLGFWYAAIFFFLISGYGAVGSGFGEWLSHFDENGVGNSEFAIFQTIPNVQIFLASFVALCGTVPMAITTSVFLPFRKRPRIVVDDRALTFQALDNTRPVRLWNDVKAVRLDEHLRGKKRKDATVIIDFHTGGSWSLPVSCLRNVSLNDLLCTIDERAPQCRFSAQAEALLAAARELALPEVCKQHSMLLAAGDFLPQRNIRVVRIISASHWSAVYLVRLDDGRQAIARQSPGGSIVEKTILDMLDHDRIGKIFETFEVDGCGFSIRNYFPGRDLDRIVREDG